MPRLIFLLSKLKHFFFKELFSTVTNFSPYPFSIIKSRPFTKSFLRKNRSFFLSKRWFFLLMRTGLLCFILEEYVSHVDVENNLTVISSPKYSKVYFISCNKLNCIKFAIKNSNFCMQLLLFSFKSLFSYSTQNFMHSYAFTVQLKPVIIINVFFVSIVLVFLLVNFCFNFPLTKIQPLYWHQVIWLLNWGEKNSLKMW